MQERRPGCALPAACKAGIMSLTSTSRSPRAPRAPPGDPPNVSAQPEVGLSLLSLRLASPSRPPRRLRSPGFWSAASSSGWALFSPDFLPLAFLSPPLPPHRGLHPILAQSRLSSLPSFLLGCLALSPPSLLFVLPAFCVSSLCPLAGPSPPLLDCLPLSPAPIPPADPTTG